MIIFQKLKSPPPHIHPLLLLNDFEIDFRISGKFVSLLFDYEVSQIPISNSFELNAQFSSTFSKYFFSNFIKTLSVFNSTVSLQYMTRPRRYNIFQLTTGMRYFSFWLFYVLVYAQKRQNLSSASNDLPQPPTS